MTYWTFEDVLEEENKKKYPIDGLRYKPVDTLIIHHSAGNNMKDKSPEEVIDFISDLHKKRFYKDGVIDSKHKHRLKDERVYCAYHFLMWPTGLSWEIIPTLWGVLDNVTGGTKTYSVNASAIQVCVMGDYSKEKPKAGFIDRFVTCFRTFGKYVQNEYKRDLKIEGHNFYDPKVCPGKIEKLLPELRKRINI